MIKHIHVVSTRDRQSLSVDQDHASWHVTGLPCFLCDEVAPRIDQPVLASIAVAPRTARGEHPVTLF